ncbi:FecR family protein [Sphingomonas sp. PAMC 26605]|uniref:FecR family protein n=1 Tax=Sphingomonas sp. PAMC 26605 TaxID=1112214 RepID=UPI00026CDDFE|nr:FecR domain-containing protein [Sphingomonas sp. PAMC 26605]
MTAEAAHIVDRAIDWQLRQDDMSDQEWHAFVAWLEEDPAHARAFDAVALDMAALADHPEVFPAATPAEASAPPVGVAPRRRAWAWAGGGVAVAAAACLTLMVVPLGLRGTASPYAVETKPGQRRDIALNDGTRIELNGASRLLLDHDNTRIATLESGEATFHVHHDAGAPFTVRSGTQVVQDVGTVFNVERDGKRLAIQVAEGSVLLQPQREAVALRAGAAATVDEEVGGITVSKVDAAKVGAWRSGAIAFAGEPFGRVAGAVLRLDGVSLTIDSSLSQRPFSGMVRLTGTAARDVPHLAALVGAEWHHDGERWFISPR